MDFYITLLIIVCLALLLWVCNYLIDDVLTSRKIKRHERELRNIAHTINKHHATPILIKDEKEEIRACANSGTNRPHFQCSHRNQ